MTRRVALGEMRLGRSSDDDVREEEERQAQLAALDSIAMPDISSAVPAPMGHEGEHDEAMQTAAPPDPETSAATAHTLDGDWSDATTEPGARTGAPRQAPPDPELDALDAMARSAPRPVRPTRADGSPVPIEEGGVDDSPDSMHAMQGRPELARDDAEPLGDQGRGQMVAPSGEAEDFAGRIDRLARGGDFQATPVAPAVAEPSGMTVEALDEGEPEFTYDGPDAEPDADADDPELAALDGMAGKPAPAEPGPRLDDGLPSEGDIGGARERDGFLGFLRSLQNGLLGAIGRPRRELPHEATDLQERRDSGLRERMQAKGVQRREEQTAERQASQDALAAERQAESDARADRGLDLREQQLEISRQSAESMDASRDAQRSHVATLDEIARASREDREDPTSAISMGAQNAYRAAIAVLPERLRSSVEASLGGDVSTMSAAQLEGVVRRLQTIGVRGSGGGTGGAPRGSSESLAQTLVERGIVETPEEAAALVDAIGARGARTAIQQSLAPSARRPSGPQPRGPTTADRAVAATRTSLAAVRHRLDALAEGADIPGVGIGDGNTPYRALSDDGRNMRNMLRDLADNYLRMTSGAAVPEHEIENFAQRLAMTDEAQFPATIERLERELEARATGQVQDPTSTYRPSGAHAPTAPTTAAPSDDQITVRRTRDGVTRRVSRSAWGSGHAGYEVVQ